MDSRRWKQIDAILQSVLDLPADRRDAHLHDACAGDPALEREVRSLIAVETPADRFLEQPAAVIAAGGEPMGRRRASQAATSAAPSAASGREVRTTRGTRRRESLYQTPVSAIRVSVSGQLMQTTKKAIETNQGPSHQTKRAFRADTSPASTMAVRIHASAR